MVKFGEAFYAHKFLEGISLQEETRKEFLDDGGNQEEEYKQNRIENRG
jgi:hypothetical protein